MIRQWNKHAASYLGEQVPFKDFLKAAGDMDVRIAIGNLFHSMGALRLNSLLEADFSDLEWTFGTINLVVSFLDHSPFLTGLRSSRQDDR